MREPWEPWEMRQPWQVKLQPDAVCFNAAISACGKSGEWQAALAQLARMFGPWHSDFKPLSRRLRVPDDFQQFFLSWEASRPKIHSGSISNKMIVSTLFPILDVAPEPSGIQMLHRANLG